VWAIAILKAKNRLSPNNAKQVEAAFEAKMAKQDLLPEVDLAEADRRQGFQVELADCSAKDAHIISARDLARFFGRKATP
jgi:hypothetical protein